VSIERFIGIGLGVVILTMALPYIAPGVFEVRPPGEARPDPAAGTAATPSQPVPGYSRQVALSAGPGGDYVAEATIDGITVRVVVDTGASMVALSAETASRLGIRPDVSRYVIPVSTANGVVAAAPVRIARIRLGSLDVTDVDAAVLPPGALSINLLGMSFLNKLSKFEAGGGQMVLVQ
jgi:aspartyl protease family protein